MDWMWTSSAPYRMPGMVRVDIIFIFSVALTIFCWSWKWRGQMALETGTEELELLFVGYSSDATPVLWTVWLVSDRPYGCNFLDIRECHVLVFIRSTCSFSWMGLVLCLVLCLCLGDSSLSPCVFRVSLLLEFTWHLSCSLSSLRYKHFFHSSFSLRSFIFLDKWEPVWCNS